MSLARKAAAALALGKLTLSAAQRRRGLDLRGKVAVVCGGSRGLGLAIARVLVDEGANVAFCARTPDAVDAACEDLTRRARSRVTVYSEPCDLRRRHEVERFFANVTSRLGPIDLLVANAATITVAPIESLDECDFDRAMDDIFKTALHAALAVVPSMRARRKGTIAFITSIGGKIGVPHLAPYSAAKFAEVGFAQALGAEVAKDGINVLTVVPGLMRTGSPVHGQFGGDPEKEYAWFTASANAPLVTIEAARAAKRIVAAIERGATELTYTPAARVAARLHDVTPSLFHEALRLAGRLLPRVPRASANGTTEKKEGIAIEKTSASSVVAAVGAWNRPFAERYGQLRR